MDPDREEKLGRVKDVLLALELASLRAQRTYLKARVRWLDFRIPRLEKRLKKKEAA